MSRLKKNEFYVVAVNMAAGEYQAAKWNYNEMWNNDNTSGVRWSAVYLFCMVYDNFKNLKEVRKFCKELDKEGYIGHICKN